MKDISEKQFAELVESQRANIYSVCYMYGQNPDDVSDLFQECLINIWKGLPGFKGDSAIGTWIYRICLNTCISAGRKSKQRGDQVSLDVAGDVSSPPEDDRQAQMLHKRIRALGPLDRAIVLLWLEDLPYDEIAAIVGITAQNVGVRLYRIKQQLKSTDNANS
ncbi:MAG: RNA polymerase sigma factor [Muribaculaceae bacterium]